MQQPIIQIRDRLFAGLDQEYNVVDMGIVIEVISQLENYAITKEALEATRLGKHINELRRKAQDKLLANRAKSLVKKWRQLLVSPAAEPPSSGGNNNTIVMNGHISKSSAVSRLSSPAIVANGCSLPSSANTSPCTSRPPSPPFRNGSRSSSPVVLDSVPRTEPSNKRLRKEDDEIVSAAKKKKNSEKKAPDSLSRKMASVIKASGKVLTTKDLVLQLALKSSSPNPPSSNTSSAPPSPRAPTPVRDPVESILDALPPLDIPAIMAELEEVAAEDQDEEVDGLIPVLKPRPDIDEEFLNSFHENQLESLTGNFDIRGHFKEWHEVVEKDTKEGDVLYVLPYCIID